MALAARQCLRTSRRRFLDSSSAFQLCCLAEPTMSTLDTPTAGSPRRQERDYRTRANNYKCTTSRQIVPVAAALRHRQDVARRRVRVLLPDVHPDRRRPHAPHEREQDEDVQQAAHAQSRRAGRAQQEERDDATARRVLQHGQQREAADGHDDDERHEVHGVHVDDVHLLQATMHRVYLIGLFRIFHIKYFLNSALPTYTFCKQRRTVCFFL